MTQKTGILHFVPNEGSILNIDQCKSIELVEFYLELPLSNLEPIVERIGIEYTGFWGYSGFLGHKEESVLNTDLCNR